MQLSQLAETFILLIISGMETSACPITILLIIVFSSHSQRPNELFPRPRNENLNLLVRIKFLNLFFNRVLNNNGKIYLAIQSFTGLGLEDRCSSCTLISKMTYPSFELF